MTGYRRGMVEVKGRIGGDNSLLTMRQAAERVHVSYHRFAASYKPWGIRFVRFPNGRIMFRVRHLESWLDSLTEEPKRTA
jgi:hypothetical protein